MTIAEAIRLAPPSRARRMRDRQRQIERFESRILAMRQQLARLKDRA